MPRRAVLLAVTAIATSLVACSSSSSSASGPVDAKFRTTATAACETTLQQMTTQPFPWDKWNPTDPEVSQLPAVGTYLDNVAINHRELGFVQAMGKPKTGAKTWQQFVTLIGQQQSIMAAQISSAKASDKPAFVATVNQIKALATQIDATGKAVGFADGSYCLKLFG